VDACGHCAGSVETFLKFGFGGFGSLVMRKGELLEALIDLECDTECIRKFLVEGLECATLGSRERLGELAGFTVSTADYPDKDVVGLLNMATHGTYSEGVTT
jgi:hypothetical protein